MPEMSGAFHSSKNARRRFGNLAAALPNLVEAGFEPVSELLRVGLAPDEPAEHPDHLENFRDASLVERDDGDAAPYQLRGEIRLQIREGEDQVRFERHDLVELRAREGRDSGLPPCLGRPDRVPGHADDAMTLSKEVERFSGFFRQADDPFRITAHGGEPGPASGRQTRIRHARPPRRRRQEPVRLNIGSVVGKRMELAAFPARVDSCRQFVKECCVEFARRRSGDRAPAGPHR